MAPWLRALAILAEDGSSAFSTHIGRLTFTCNSSCKGSNTLFRSPRAPTHMCTDVHTHIYINNTVNLKKERSFKKYYVYRTYISILLKLLQSVLQNHLSIIVFFCENRKVSKLAYKKKKKVTALDRGL